MGVEEWRYLDHGASDACTNMAVDEAVLQGSIRGVSPPTLRLYTWKPSAVSIGFFQSVEQEVDLEACRELGVDVIRRITGGGAVYHDRQGELTYSIVVPESWGKTPKDFLESYRFLCRGLVLGLRQMGVEAEFTPINDITVRGRKISGNAQTRRSGSILQHGTLLLQTDIPTIFRVLKVSKEKLSDKAVRAFEGRVTTLLKETGRKPELERVKETLKKGFEEALEVRLTPGRLTEGERAEAEKLKRKYSSREWTFRR
ncbi:biotin/lipoate A/B protein ligase family protein [Candidatus Hecatella orcuttiae]|jgi:lipoate-protein ligase A|uniref:lipoate--protein ligase family protein n=1 Tax=Candidatus Hecatella orcuttiae TaxID=1935119 RepID=UPI002868314F|nr:biotin/lipoate A/B protein ligase family protein [Candidatus Hecatella orcuttiae]